MTENEGKELFGMLWTPKKGFGRTLTIPIKIAKEIKFDHRYPIKFTIDGSKLIIESVEEILKNEVRAIEHAKIKKPQQSKAIKDKKKLKKDKPVAETLATQTTEPEEEMVFTEQTPEIQDINDMSITDKSETFENKNTEDTAIKVEEEKEDFEELPPFEWAKYENEDLQKNDESTTEEYCEGEKYNVDKDDSVKPMSVEEYNKEKAENKPEK